MKILNLKKKQLDWTGLAGLLNGLYLTLEKQESISNLPYFKLLMTSLLTLTLNENSDLSTAILTSGISINSPIGSFFNKSEPVLQIPVTFSKSLIKLVGAYINSLKETANFENFLGNSTALNSATPVSLIYMMNLILPLLIWSASDRKNSPKLNKQDMNYVVSFLLNAVRPPSKLAATLLLQAPKQQFLSTPHEATAGGNAFNKSKKQLKDIITQTSFLGKEFQICLYFLVNKN